MPVGRGPRRPTRPTVTPPVRPQGTNQPAWMPPGYSPTVGPGGGATPGNVEKVYGPRSQKYLRGSTVREGGTIYQESPEVAAPETVGGGTNTRRMMRGTPTLGVTLEQQNKAQTYVAQPQTYTAPLTPKPTNVPTWMSPYAQTPTNGLQPGTFNPYAPIQQQVYGQTQPTQQQQPYRRMNAQGQWEYLQADGSYLASTGIAGGTGGATRNSYLNLPPLRLVPPAPGAASYGSSPFSTRYGNYPSRGGSVGYDYSSPSYAQRAPNWLMNLNSWNFGE